MLSVRLRSKLGIYTAAALPLAIVLAALFAGVKPVTAQQPNPNCIKEARVFLYTPRLRIQRDNEFLVILSAGNAIYCPPMNIQLQLEVPPGIIPTTVIGVESGPGAYESSYVLPPGKREFIQLGLRGIEVGPKELVGRLRYFYGNETSTGATVEDRRPIHIVGDDID